MARATTRFLALAMVMMMAGVIISDHRAFAQSCDNNVVQGLVSQCEQYVTRGGPQDQPSTTCCDVVKKAKLECVCKYVTPAVELMIDPKKVVYVAQTCGVPIPHGTKCGSITVP
ncbi:Xylogen-like protein [Actinidia chinensis var. chinensis]|uniref:Xylogen-like protein n=1 Tax=Actinidia chinensis var. chinensis TaxID=1590841 RepID=A0A2R6P866_ACTCC|nr:Xylogen-like protein [Actinidia chinensis var. chinensis]